MTNPDPNPRQRGLACCITIQRNADGVAVGFRIRNGVRVRVMVAVNTNHTLLRVVLPLRVATSTVASCPEQYSAMPSSPSWYHGIAVLSFSPVLFPSPFL